MAIEIRKAQKQKARLRLGISGPSGSGKTYSALMLANGIVDWEKICIIDTENGSADLYSGLGGYSVIPLSQPYSPESYIEAISAAESAGFEVIIIDSITHEWSGVGGILELQEQLGGRYQDWGKVKPRHRKFVDKILQSPAHVITTVRSKQDYAMDQSDGKTRVQKLGLKQVTEEGFEYELTLGFDLMLNHLAKASKDRTGLFMDKPEFIVNQQTGKVLKDWSESGSEPMVTNSPLVIDQIVQEIEAIKTTEDARKYHLELEKIKQQLDPKDLEKLKQVWTTKMATFKKASPPKKAAPEAAAAPTAKVATA